MLDHSVLEQSQTMIKHLRVAVFKHAQNSETRDGLGRFDFLNNPIQILWISFAVKMIF